MQSHKQLNAIHLRHIYVGDHKVWRIIGEVTQGSLSIARTRDSVPSILKHHW